MPERLHPLPFEIDHIIAQQHGGETKPSNLAWACFSCNKHKGPNLSGIDPKTGKPVWLFNPREQKWSRHFRWKGLRIVGRTAVGRATAVVLSFNRPMRIAHRVELSKAGSFPF
jgi:hypothetical protein